MQINSVDTAKVSKTDRIDMYASGSSSDASTKSNAKISNITNPKGNWWKYVPVAAISD